MFKSATLLVAISLGGILSLENSSILITGGTGSFGHAFVPTVLERHKPERVIIYSRDEMKQWEMAKLFEGDPRVRFFIGDVRDRDRMYRAVDGVDYVVHAAATKIVPTAEYNPFEAVKTNILGAMNLVDACIDKGVKKVVALSTDKASSPVNLYGATKLASDKMFVAGNHYAGAKPTRFSVVRFGNVMGSRGSVLPHFWEAAKGSGPLTVTDERMTRFMITLDKAVDLVFAAFEDMLGGEIYVKKIPSMGIMQIAEAMAPGKPTKVVGSRPGEKLHEQMIGPEDAPTTYEYADYFKILPSINTWDRNANQSQGGQLVPEGFIYTSDSNPDWMTVEELRQWVSANLANPVKGSAPSASLA
jgi:UDP-N-acetylglucosamine 4,6-dehydratase